MILVSFIAYAVNNFTSVLSLMGATATSFFTVIIPSNNI